MNNRVSRAKAAFAQLRQSRVARAVSAIGVGVLMASPAFAEIDVSAATTALTTDGTEALTTVGTALLTLAGIAVVFKWAKAAFFG